jgi:hypothetical protein
MSDSAQDGNTHFRETEEADLVTYRSLSLAALVAAIFGVFSFTALLYPLLLIVPLVAFVSGWLALRSIAVSSAGLTGRRLAVAGILLATLFASGAVTRLTSRDWIVTSRARRFADDWLQLVLDGHREAAYEMSLPPSMRQTPGVDLEKIYGEDPKKNDALQRYFADSPARELVKFGPAGKLHYEGILDAGRNTEQGDLVGLEYLLEYREGDETKSTRIQLAVQRKLHGKNGRGQWTLQHVGTAEERERRLEQIRDLQSS